MTRQGHSRGGIARTWIWLALMTFGALPLWGCKEANVELALHLKNQANYALASPPTYTAKITGCTSGFTLEGIDQDTSSVDVLVGDQGCRLELVTIQLDGETFSFSGADDWNDGSTFSRQGSAGGAVDITVVKNLNSPITADEQVEITFSLVQLGTKNQVSITPDQIKVQAGILISGSGALNLSVAKITGSVDSADLAGVFDVLLECASPVEQEHCDGVSLTTIKAHMLRDTYGTQMTAAQCRAEADKGLPGSAVAASASADAPQGGLLVAGLRGPAPYDAPENSELLLVVSSAEAGCKIFPVEVLANEPPSADAAPAGDAGVAPPPSNPDAGEPPPGPTRNLVAVSFYAYALKNFANAPEVMAAIDNSPYTGVALPPYWYGEPKDLTKTEFDETINTLKGTFKKDVWPWIFFNNFMCDIPNNFKNGDVASLNQFYNTLSVSLQIAKDLGSPGIVIDPELYWCYDSYSWSSMMSQSGKTVAEVKQKLNEIGAHISDIIDNEYPDVRVLSFFTSLWMNSPYTIAGVFEGMMMRAKEKNMEYTLIIGGEMEDDIGYCSENLAHLQQKVANRPTLWANTGMLATYPNLTYGATIAPWDKKESKTNWLLEQKDCSTSTIDTIYDFVPLFQELLTHYQDVWIYAAWAAGYNPFDATAAAKYNPGLEQALVGFN